MYTFLFQQYFVLLISAVFIDRSKMYIAIKNICRVSTFVMSTEV